jgi:outer membrane autotransporter protein
MSLYLRMSRTSCGSLIAAAMVIAPGPAAAQTNQVTVTVTLTVTAVATVDVAKVQTETRAAIRSMLAQRANVLASSGPDTARMHARLSGGSLFGGPTDGSAPGGTPDAGFAPRPNRSGVFDRFAPSGGSFSGGRSATGGVGPGLDLGDSPDRRALFASPFDRFSRRESLSGGSLNDAPALPFGMRRDYDGIEPERRAGHSGARLTANGDDTGGRFQFAASLSQVRAAAEAAERAKASALDPVAALTSGTPRTPGTARPAAFDIWLEGTSTYYRNDTVDGRRRGHAGVVLGGVDLLARPWLLVGVLAQLDWMSDSADANGRPREGRGWMAGPYASARLTPNIYFDTRAAYGRSSNHIDPTGGAVDMFETSRALLSAKLTGDWTAGAWRLRPSAELVWFKEEQAAYTNAIGIAIASNAVHLGRLSAGPEVGYLLRLADGTGIEPFVGAKAVWDFAVSDQTSSTGAPIGHDGLRARLEGGLAIRLPAGIALRATGAYDGVGSSNYRAVQGQARLTVPLQ